MARSLYITTMEPRSGKSVVSLGMMELLCRRVSRVGFFRPIVRSHETRDNEIELISRRYKLDAAYEEMFAYTYDETWEMILAGRQGELLKGIVDKFKALESKCEFVLCDGTGFSSAFPAMEFDLNTDIARNLGSPTLPIINGKDKSCEQIIEALHVGWESFRQEGNSVVATIINRVSGEVVDEVRAQLDALYASAGPVYVMGEAPGLGKPTMAEVKDSLGGECLFGEPEDLNREIYHPLVAAMQLPNFLNYVVDGSLIITPGDRCDVLVGSIASQASETFANIAGIVLTGGLVPEPSIIRLVEGLRKSRRAIGCAPIISVETDTYTTATKVDAIPAVIAPDNERKIASAIGLFEACVDMSELEQRIEVAGSPGVTPIMFEYELVRRAKADKKHVVLPEGSEERILRAAEILLKRDVVELTLLGNCDEIRQKIASLGLDISDIGIVDPQNSEWHDDFAETYYELRKHKGITEQTAGDLMTDVSYFGTMMVYKGLADAMVSGSVHTTQHTIRPAFQFIRAADGVSIVSSVFFMCLEDRVLVYGDCAVNPNPTAEQLADIAISSAQTARMFRVEPRIAMLSYSTGASGKGEDVERVRKAVEIARKRRGDLLIEGPIQYDAAADVGVAKTKMPNSEIAGRATVFIFPDLNTGNNTYKAVQRSAGAVAIGPVLQGLKKPVNDLSRGCTVTDIVNTVAITAIQAQESDA